MSKDSDLSAYELQRLENIRRNAEFLAQLGLVPISKHVEERKREAEVIREKKKAVKAVRNTKEVSLQGVAVRRSSRLSAVKEEVVSSPTDTKELDEEELMQGYPQVC